MMAIWDGSAAGAVNGLQNLYQTAIPGNGNQGAQNSSNTFLNEMNGLQQQELNSQYGLAKQQQAFNDTMQQASENAHEVAAVQTFGQDVTNARNTLTSSDQQQIK